MSKCGHEIKQKIDPNLPARPVMHSIDGNWIKEPVEQYAGMPIRLELAARFMAAIISSGNRDGYQMVTDALALADDLIEKYNQ